MKKLLIVCLLTGCGVNVNQIEAVQKICADHGGVTVVWVAHADRFDGACMDGLDVKGRIK